jgi:N utilization substance protein A
MEVIVNEDQLSLAIGKRGQNVRLATKLVGWNIDIRSEEELKKEVAAQMGAMIAAGEPVSLERLPGMNAATTAALAARGVEDIETLAATSVDDLVEFLDISLDEAESIIASAQAVIATAAAPKGEGEEGQDESAGETPAAEDFQPIEEQHAASVEADPDAEAREVEPSEESIAEGYDEAVREGSPFHAEERILARESADPVASTEAEQMSADELLLQGAGRDLRPDTITPAPDITSAEAAVIQNAGAYSEEERPSTLADETAGGAEPIVREDEGDDSPLSPRSALATEQSAPEVQNSSEPAPSSEGEPAPVENVADDEAADASGNVE